MTKRRIVFIVTIFVVYSCLTIGNIRGEDSLTYLKDIPLYPGQINGLAPIEVAVNSETNLIYVVNNKSNCVSVICGITNTVIKDIGVEKGPKDISIDSINNLIYVSNCGSHSITVISGATNNVVTRIDLNSRPDSLVVNPIKNRLYVGSDDTLFVISTVNNTIVSEIPIGRPLANKLVALNSNTNRIYVVESLGDKVYVVDGENNKIVTTIKINGWISEIAVNSLLNKVYISHRLGEVTVIDGETNNVIIMIPLHDNSTLKNIAINEITNKIYVSSIYKGFNIFVIDGWTNSVVTSLYVGPYDNSDPSGVAVNVDTNHIYGINQDADKVFVFNGNTNTLLKEVLVGSIPRGVTVNPKTNYLYVTNYDTDTVSVIDEKNDIVIGAIDVGINPTYIIANSEINRVYAITETGLSVINGITNELMGTVILGGLPKSIAINIDDNRVFVTDDRPGDGALFIIDGNNNIEIDRIGLLSPRGVTVNHVTNKIYVATMGKGTRGHITIIDGSNYKILKVIALPGDHWGTILTVDEILNRIYILLPGSIAILDGNADEIINTISLPNASTGIASNSDTHLLYVTTKSDNIIVINGISQSILEISTLLPSGHSPRDIGINISTNRIYTANYGSGSVSVLSMGRWVIR